MSLAVVIGVFVLVVTVAIVWITVRYMRTERVELPAELVARRKALSERLDLVISGVPDKPRLQGDEVPDHPKAAVIEAKILSDDLRGALIEAEDLLSDSADDPRVHVLLARVLLHMDETGAAWQEIKRARALQASGPMIDYLEGRAEHLRVLRRINPNNMEVQGSPVPSLITPFEMFILQLERQRQRSQDAAAIWLASLGDGTRTLDHEEITALIVEHYASYYESMDKLLNAAEQAPGFTEALYHIARLALKVGFIRQGMDLMNAIEPLMESSPEKRFYHRDLAELRDEETPAALSNLPPVATTAKRSKSLKVLN